MQFDSAEEKRADRRSIVTRRHHRRVARTSRPVARVSQRHVVYSLEDEHFSASLTGPRQVGIEIPRALNCIT